MTYIDKILKKIGHFVITDTGGFDVVDFRVGTIIGTTVLFLVPVINFLFHNILPDYPSARNILIVIQLFAILASYRIVFIQRWANEIGNLFSLCYAFLVNAVAYYHNFDVKESAFALITSFALMGMFKDKKMMLYYTFLTCTFLFVLIQISGIEEANKYFLIITSLPLYGIGIYIFTLKLDTVQNLKKRESELAQREAWFRNIFDNAPVGIVLYDENHIPFKYNKFIVELLGYSEAEMLEIGIHNLVNPEDMLSVEEFFNSNKDNNPHYVEQRMHTKKGKQLWVRIKIASMALEGKLYTITMFNDITIEKNVDIQLRESAKLLQSQNEALEEFSYVISHDLQEPLRMITSFSQIIKNRYIAKLNNDEANNDFAFVIDGAKRMSFLIRDMLEYSRWTSKLLPVEKVDTRTVLSETLQNLTVGLTQSQAQVLTGDLPVIYTNRLMLGQVFQNLIGNAVRYRHPDRLPIIEINLEKRTFDILISVKDNGLGFEDKYKERIFGIFQRLDPDKSGGTGMGLAICKRIIEKQGGVVWAESVPDEGSTFFFTLPYHDFESMSLDANDINNPHQLVLKSQLAKFENQKTLLFVN